MKRMSQRGWIVLLGLAVVGLAAAGCFQSPTNPFVNAFNGGGVHPGPGPGPGPGPNPTPTPGPGPGGSGSISGTISLSNGGTVTVIAAPSGGGTPHSTTRAGDGPYTITGLPDGTYIVAATSTSGTSGVNLSNVTITGGNSVTGVDIAMF